VADDANQAPKDIIGFLDFYFVKKAPFQIPEQGRELIVKWGPWITVVLIAITLPLILILLGLGTALVPFGGYYYASGFGLAAIFLIVYFGLMIAALPGLFARKMSGWRLMFYAEVSSLVHSLLVLAIVSAIIGGLIGFYILFQIRTKYN
jgi:hypothetical protein